MAIKQKVYIAAEVFEVDQAGKPVLIGGECSTCGHRFFPMQNYCGKCLGEEIQPFSLSRTGTLYSSTTIIQAPAGFHGPYEVGYIDVDEFRIFGRVAGEKPNIGEVVELALIPINETAEEIHISYGFQKKRGCGEDA